MDMEQVCKMYNVSLTMANSIHLEVVRLYDKDGWLELTEQQRSEVVGLVISKIKYSQACHNMLDLSDDQKNNVESMLNQFDQEETD